MAEASGKSASVVAKPPGASARVDWKAVWPLPVFAVAVVVLGAGVVTALMRAPKADPLEALGLAKEALQAREFEKAIELLNKRMLPQIAAGNVEPKEQGEVLLTRARALAGGQAALGISHPDNNRAIIADYKQAQELDAKLTPGDIVELAEASLSLGDTAKAVELARSLPESDLGRRLDIIRRVIDKNLASKDVRYDQTLALLAELQDAPTLSIDERGWVAAREAELRLSMGFGEEAIVKLLRTIPKLDGISPSRRGELLFILGRAYFEADQFAAAGRQLEAAESVLPEHDALRGEALVLAGRIQQAEGRIEEAHEKFLAVKEEYGNTSALLPALLGLAETAAGRREDDVALDTYEELEHALAKQPDARRGVSHAVVGRSLMERFQDRENAGEFGQALKFVQLAEKGFAAAGEVPAEVLAGLGRSYRKVAETMLDDARASDSGRLPIDQLSPVTQAEVKRRLLEAGAAFREHARRMVVENAGEYRRSLWSAADSFDLGGDAESAKMAFKAYVEDTPPDDPFRAEARFRLAQLFEAERDFSAAASEYAQLYQARGKSGEGVGPVADRSIVPLARCYFNDAIADNDSQGEELLAQVISGATFEPTSEFYREALIELGERKHKTGSNPAAIRLLDESARRYPDHPRANVVHFKLADACRLSAAEIDRELAQAMPQARREQLERLRHDRLTTAGEAFQRVIDGVNAKDKRQVTPVEQLARRNSAFYLGDCAFELRDYDRAIDFYDAARQRYAEDPASLVAMMQIVNCYVAQQKWDEALTANERARQQLAAMSDDVWKSPDLPIDRTHWERWLDSSTLLDARRRSSAAAKEPGSE